MSKSSSFFPSITIKDFPGASNFLPFSSSMNTTNNTSTIPSIHNQNHGAKYGTALQYKSVIDFGGDKVTSDDISSTEVGSLSIDSVGVAVHPDVRRIIEEEEETVPYGSPSKSPIINRRRDRRALKKFRETSRHSRPLRGPGTSSAWSPDICKLNNNSLSGDL